MENYNNIFENFIKDNSIKKHTLDDQLKTIGYVSFFNDITSRCLGEPLFTHDKLHQTTSSLIYLPDEAKEKAIVGFDIVYISQLYLGIMTNGTLDFNYKGYEEFLKDLVSLRVSLKKSFVDNPSELTEIKIQLIKIYMNIIYGMIDKPQSILTSGLENPREHIVENAKKVVLSIASFFLNKSMPIYYIDTDELFVPHISETIYHELQEYFKNECKSLINTTISNAFIEEDESNISAYLAGKKKYMIAFGNRARVQGLPKVNDSKVLLQNKKFFGTNYRDIFPEYAIW